MNKLRPLPILLTVLLSGAVLFGGWFSYQSFAVERPFMESMASIDGVEVSEPVIERDSVTVKLKLESGIDLMSVYHEIKKQGSALIGSKELKLDVEQVPSPELEKIWSSVLFEVAQAMDNQLYASIPEAAADWMDEYDGLNVVTSMDDTNVYITLEQSGETKFVILPRIPAKMGVWPNA
ncbi:hypothetical protein DNH61_23430 [Paenibacillus sambharensis]|uniref:Uncharacterized protein n=1 Tax=Paenibacillus sambharensis TaxID=1803190 RepID=A0A2W1L3F5_9BACL|nr:hypothetical protein [Paenibacillus sambharensis]PZD93573.1 hypothetical protein DNH61_23430 [Paenibacillus sambharensis]